MDNHIVTLENRAKMTVTDISEIDSFDEQEIRASLNQESIIIKGEKLHIQVLDLTEGKAVISGKVDSITYGKAKEKDSRSIVARLLK